ncbi:GntR family transcriptional regulator [Mucilaginibacter gracilis]|uniref:Transcriptional regulator, GntR family n=2 Tax=Mucilaginibacter TaxID=423349 RepID=H1YHP4_9SPHI|nr:MULTISPECIES: GntR family transcriptional regulator [Mucilaginibacter]EHQ27444.1 transcriptional regulator, GntR family [Mucilaginibacter paludis DSM 18603]RKR81011.1 GntR family transcriptional regulator [Mucilaginibacter gracilis]
MAKAKINYNNTVPLVEQIVMTISRDIEKGVYKRNQQLLSINTYSRQYGVARDTIEKAYTRLRTAGYISSVKGKGYFVNVKSNKTINVLLIFNELSSHKKIVFDSIVSSLGAKVKVDLRIHHGDLALLDEIIDQSLSLYHYYVILPLFREGINESVCISTLRKVPDSQLILLDKTITGFKPAYSVCQDYTNDILNVLRKNSARLAKYEKLILLIPSTGHQQGIIEGLMRFATESSLGLEIRNMVEKNGPYKGEVYLTLDESELIILLKKIKENGLLAGNEIGLISYHDTPFKELLGITVLTTDLEAMGKMTAKMILENKPAQIINPFKIIIRQSL